MVLLICIYVIFYTPTLGIVASFLSCLQNQLFSKILSGISSECQTNWVQIRPDKTSGLIWVQSVCVAYVQTKLVGDELNTFRVVIMMFNSMSCPV